jgi:anthranilate phosphoribosyltransferase
MIKEAISKLVENKDLRENEAKEAMLEIMEGKATESQISAFLTALRIKGETQAEFTAFAQIMREKSVRIYPKVQGRLVDTCGTGGASLKTFNISTVSAFVAAGAGVPIAKHGNRSVTSKCGSADVLEALGANISQEPSLVEKSIEKIGIGFMFAPTFHPAMKYAVKPRKEIGVRTVFNILGPLTNPAGAKGQLIGVFSEELVKKITPVVQKLGIESGLVVYGTDGLDEISTLGKTMVGEVNNGDIKYFYLSPSDLGFKKADHKNITISTMDEGVRIMKDILSGNEKNNERNDIVMANAGAAIYVCGKADSIMDGIELARESVKSGRAHKKLVDFIKLSRGEAKKD